MLAPQPPVPSLELQDPLVAQVAPPMLTVVPAPQVLPAPPARESLRLVLLGFARTLIVGFWANILDFALLAVCFRWLHFDAMPSRAIALLTSAVITFVGCRAFAFRAKAGSVPKQATRFVVSELVGVLLNLASFRLCTLCAPLAVPELVSAVANALVFVGFSYPVRKLVVFAVPPTL